MSMDSLKEYIESLQSKYTGVWLCRRIQLIVLHLQKMKSSSPSDAAHLQALSHYCLSFLEGAIRSSTSMFGLHRDACKALGITDVAAWADTAEATFKSRREALEREHTLQCNSNNRELQVRALIDLAILHFQTGLFQEAALSLLNKARESAVSSKMITEISLLQWQYFVYSNRYDMAHTHLKAEMVAAGDSPNDTVLASKLAACHALQLLESRKYSEAASAFFEVHPSMAGSFPPLHAEDAGCLGLLCLLATASRDNLRARVNASPGKVRDLLESNPELLKAAKLLDSSHYAAALNQVQRLQHLKLDLHVGFTAPSNETTTTTTSHLAKLLKEITTTALTSYMAPYCAVDLASMTAAFHFDSVEKTEKKVIELIELGKVTGRVDPITHTFTGLKRDARAEAFKKVDALTENIMFQAQQALIKTSLAQAGPSFLARSAASSRADHDYMEILCLDGDLLA